VLRSRITSALEIIGATSVVVGFAMFNTAAAFIVGGALSIAFGMVNA
jgi:hypothetical protein